MLAGPGLYFPYFFFLIPQGFVLQIKKTIDRAFIHLKYPCNVIGVDAFCFSRQGKKEDQESFSGRWYSQGFSQLFFIIVEDRVVQNVSVFCNEVYYFLQAIL